MKKIWSLIKAVMSYDMSIFKLKTKSQKKSSKILFLIFISLILFMSIYYYADMFMKPLHSVNLEYVLLTLFILITSIMALMEGIYKSSSLLFNCKDDNLLLSLPIKKSTVLFLRVLKFYLFELLYNSLLLIPAIFVYVRYVNVSFSFYIVTLFGILLFPIIPIIISCFIGGIVSSASAKFKFKNFAQIFITTLFILLIMYFSFNLEKIISNLAENATSINDLITKLYYPAGAYISLITEFNIGKFLLFIFIHLILFGITILILSNVYFKINTNIKAIKVSKKSNHYTIKAYSQMISFIKKELNRFINTPVFVINAAFGLVLFIVMCIIITFKMDTFASLLSENNVNFSKDTIMYYIPVIHFALIAFASLMSSITSSMISLEGKSFTILKCLPISPTKIIISKVLTAVIIMIPCIFIGNIILFVKYNYGLLEIMLLTVISIVLPMVAELIGILVNLKYPKLDFSNDTEVVKQSISSTIAVFIGMALTGITIGLVIKAITINLDMYLILIIGLCFYLLLLGILLIYMNKKSVQEFNNINI